MEEKTEIFSISQSDIIDVFKRVFETELYALSPIERDEIIEIAQSNRANSADIGADMDFDIPFTIEQINEWLECIKNIIELAIVFIASRIGEKTDVPVDIIIEETTEDDFYEFVRTKAKGKKTLYEIRSVRKIKATYKDYKSKVIRKMSKK